MYQFSPRGIGRLPIAVATSSPVAIKESSGFGWGFFMLGVPRSRPWTRSGSYAIYPPHFSSYGTQEAE
jgi:hypothetical protein